LAHVYLAGADRPQSLSEISDRTSVALSTAQREIERLERAGLVASERIGNTRLIRANTASPYFADLQSLLFKAFGPPTLLASLLRPIPGIDRAFIYGSWARRERSDDAVVPRDLDVLVIGAPDLDAVYAAARRAESELDLEVNPLIVSGDEWSSPQGLLKRIKAGPLIELELSDGAAETDDR
jgi:DNA-binding transcriptional ArsR family regulator